MDFFYDIARYAYLHNALAACILSGIACGIMGTYVVCRRTVFLAGGITHASFGGLGIAFYLGLNPIAGALVFAVLSALGIEWAGNRGRIREDSAIGIIWSVGMALGVLFMSLRPGYTSGDLAGYLFGSIVTVSGADVAALAALTALVVAGAALWLRPVMYVAFDREFARRLLSHGGPHGRHHRAGHPRHGHRAAHLADDRPRRDDEHALEILPHDRLRLRRARRTGRSGRPGGQLPVGTALRRGHNICPHRVAYCGKTIIFATRKRQNPPRMKTIHKLVLKSYLGPMFLTFFIVMFVLMMNFIWRYIDELVGKGLDAGVIIELMSYAMANMIPMGLPLAMLLAAIMTLGNLGENYELLAMKSAGMSLPKILKPLIIVVGIIAIGSFFVVNNLVPYANKKMLSILYDIRQQKQVIEFQDGLFFNGIEDMSIRVGKQDPKTHLLRDVLIYDNRNINGNMTTTVADSGYIRLSDDKKYLLVTLFNGETYEQTRNYQWYSKSALRHHIFEKQDGVIPMEGFGFERSDANFSNQSTTKNIAQLDRAIDSLELTVNSATTRSYEPLLREQIFANDNQVLPLPDSARIDKSGFRDALIADSIARLGLRDRDKVWGIARANAKNSRGLFSFDESTAKEALNQLYRSKIEWHRKISLPISIMIFFLIGAPLGAIIRKGGLGTPIVISVIFFVIYYIISISGEKAAREGNWEAFYGMWLSSFILAPIAVYLTYKATNDSVLLDVDWYTGRIKYYKEKWGIHTPKWMSALAGRFKRKPEENK